MACSLAGAKPLSETTNGMLLIGPLETNFSEILIKSLYVFIQENALENVVWKMAAILSRPQCVKQGDCEGASVTPVTLHILSSQIDLLLQHPLITY